MAKRNSTKYITVKIPDGLTRKIDELVQDSKGDFTSRTDVIKYAVRLLYHSKIPNRSTNL
jgi:Arc/MetJ-type ribon-helix-helix transcriptional regulator